METSTKLSTPKKMLEDLHMIGLILIASLIQKNAVQVDETVRRIKKKVAIFETTPLPAAPNSERVQQSYRETLFFLCYYTS
jgi:hypothetical protein